ncbi:MAG: HAD hydrolase-like protein [bacterium]
MLFDIDGTLLTCGGAGRNAVARVFERRFGDAATLSFSYGGMTDRGIMRRGLIGLGEIPEESLIDVLITEYLAELDAELGRTSTFAIFPEAVALARRLQGAAFAVGLGTGNVEAGARLKLRRGGIDEFEFGGFGCDHEDRATLISRGIQRGRARLGRDDAPAVVIGDTPLDVLAAHACGAQCIAVATGGYSALELAPHNPDILVDAVDDLSVLEFLST